MYIQRMALGALLFLIVCLCPVVSHGQSSPVPGYSDQFIWVGKVGQQFSEKEYQYLSQFPFVILSKFHGGWDLNKHHEAARQIKALNPNTKVLVYLGASLWFKMNQFGQGFREEWLVHDNSGNKVPMFSDDRGSYYIDLDNTAYRAWALDLMAGWMQLTLTNGKPLYDGIAFDSAIVFNTSGPGGNAARKNRMASGPRRAQLSSAAGRPNTPRMNRLVNFVGVQKVEAINNGLQAFMRETKQKFPDRIILFNGLADKPFKINRSLALFQNTDAALDEDFCFQRGSLANESEIMRDVDLMLDSRYASKLFFEKTNIKKPSGDVSPEERSKYQRYCYGSFLLGYTPGRTFFKYAEFGGRSEKELLYAVGGEIEDARGKSIDPGEVKLNLGKPMSGYQREDGVYKRSFENGTVYVNMTGAQRSVNVSQASTIMNGGVAGKSYNAGESLDVPPGDAVFLMKK